MWCDAHSFLLRPASSPSDQHSHLYRHNAVVWRDDLWCGRSLSPVTADLPHSEWLRLCLCIYMVTFLYWVSTLTSQSVRRLTLWHYQTIFIEIVFLSFDSCIIETDVNKKLLLMTCLFYTELQLKNSCDEHYLTLISLAWLKFRKVASMQYCWQMVRPKLCRPWVLNDKMMCLIKQFSWTGPNWLTLLCHQYI